MSSNPLPRYTSDLLLGLVKISAAETSLTAPTSTGTVYAVPTEQGAVIDQYIVKAEGATTSGMVRIFLKRSTTFYLLDEIDVTAITPGATIQAFESIVTPTEPIRLEASDELHAATHNAENFVVIAIGGKMK